MVKSGAPMDDIYREMDKCQLLCISCHKIVTKMEHQCGFVRLKKQMEDTEEKRQEYSAIYQRLMTPIYHVISAENASIPPVPPSLPAPPAPAPSLSPVPAHSSRDGNNTSLTHSDEAYNAHPFL